MFSEGSWLAEYYLGLFPYIWYLGIPGWVVKILLLDSVWKVSIKAIPGTSDKSSGVTLTNCQKKFTITMKNFILGMSVSVSVDVYPIDVILWITLLKQIWNLWTTKKPQRTSCTDNSWVAQVHFIILFRYFYPATHEFIFF